MGEDIIKVEINRKAVLRRAFYGLLLYSLLRFKGLITIPIVTRYLSPDDYGLINVSWATVNMLWPILALGLHTGSGLFLVHLRERDEIRRAYYTAVNAMGITVMIGTALMIATARWTGLDTSLGGYLWVTALFLITTVLKETGTLILQLFQRTKSLTVINTVVEIGSVIVALVLLMRGWGISGMLWAYTLVTLAGALWMHLSHLREFGYYRGIDRDLLRKFLATGLPLLPVSFSQWALQSLDSFFLLHYHGSYVVGIKSVAYGFASLVLGVLSVLNYFYYPTLAAVWRESRDRYATLCAQSLRFVTLLLGWVLLMFVLGNRTLILTLAGARFGEAHTVMPIITACFCMFILTQMVQATVLAISQRTIKITGVYLGALAVNVVFNVLLIPKWGLWGAAVATLISYGAMLIGIMVIAYAHPPLRALARVLLISLVPLGLLVFPTSVLAPWMNGIPVTAAGQLVLTAVYCGVAWGLRIVSRKDITALMSSLGGA